MGNLSLELLIGLVKTFSELHFSQRLFPASPHLSPSFHLCWASMFSEDCACLFLLPPPLTSSSWFYYVMCFQEDRTDSSPGACFVFSLVRNMKSRNQSQHSLTWAKEQLQRSSTFLSSHFHLVFDIIIACLAAIS